MSLRSRFIARPLFRYVKSALPRISATEREALEAGDVWWDAAVESADAALAQDVISQAEHQALLAAAEAVSLAVAVDHFDARTLSPTEPVTAKVFSAAS